MLALLGTAVVSLVLVTPTAVADGPRDVDGRLWRSQQRLLDPQTRNGVPVSRARTEAARRADLHRSHRRTPTFAGLPPSVGGHWGYLDPLTAGFNAVHVVVGRNKILLVAGSGNEATGFEAGTFSSYVCSASMSGCRPVDTPVDLFCAGHVLLPDGRALVGGGTISYRPFRGAKFMYAFDFASERYERLTPLEVGRWYPTMVTTINGQTLITGGLDENGALTGTTEVFDHHTDTHRRLAGERKFPMYPRLALTKRLDYFFSGVGYGEVGTTPPGFWDPVKNTYQPVAGLRTPKQRSSAASCFVGDLRNQDLLVLGGGSPAVDTTDRIKLSAAQPRFVPGPTLRARKQYLSCLSLPDGSLLEVGGGGANKITDASYAASLLASVDAGWTALNPIPAGNHRLYHSSHFLLDDGRVVSLGSDPTGQPRSETVLVYSPPYVYKGTRPTIVSAPTVVQRYSTIPVETTGGATRLTITKAPSPTHGMDVADGYMSFPITNGKVDLSQGLARYLPTGYYRIWAVNAKGAVSKAKWVKLCDPSTQGQDCGGCCH